MTASIMSYAYSEGPTTGSTAAYQANSTLGLATSLGWPPTVYYSRPTAPTLWTNLLTTWASSLSAQTSGTVAISWLTTGHVRITSTVPVAPVFPGSAASYLGITQDILTLATTWTGASPATGAVRLVGCTVRPPEDGSKVSLDTFRHGRAWATAWSAFDTQKVTIYLKATDGDVLGGGWCVTGRIRLYQDETVLTAYSSTNLAGYVDGYVIESSGLKAYGASEDFLSLELLLAVPR